MPAFDIQRRMHISVQGDFYIGMPKYFAEAFDIRPAIDTIGGKSMAECVKIFLFHTRCFQVILEFILIGTGLHRMIFIDYIRKRFTIIKTQKIHNLIGQRDFSLRKDALWISF